MGERCFLIFVGFRRRLQIFLLT